MLKEIKKCFKAKYFRETIFNLSNEKNLWRWNISVISDEVDLYSFRSELSVRTYVNIMNISYSPNDGKLLRNTAEPFRKG